MKPAYDPERDDCCGLAQCRFAGACHTGKNGKKSSECAHLANPQVQQRLMQPQKAVA